MAPASNVKANYKTYEAQARMVRAIVAAHPEIKWNYKEIAACYGSDMTDHALNHRFRKVRASTNIISIARAQGFDIKDLTTDENLLPSTQQAIDKNSRLSNLVVSSLHQHLLTSSLYRHCQILWTIHYRRNSVPVPHYQEGRRGSSSNC
jgi:ssRNA-specific RNase YbeY (16S rRNA maturation enzyme)